MNLNLPEDGDLLLFPLHDADLQHWSLLILDLTNDSIRLLDSITGGSRHNRKIAKFRNF